MKRTVVPIVSALAVLGAFSVAVVAQEMQVETQKLAAVAGNGLDALKGQLGPTGKSCSNCHEDFRAK